MSRNLRIGLFLIATLAIFAGAIFFVGRQESKFGSNYKVRSEFKNVAGLNEGADVRVGGIRKGAVRQILLPKHPDGRIVVEMDVAKETQNIVKTDSVAAIQSEGLLGDKYVEISFGSADAEGLKGGETIEGEAPFDITDLITQTRSMLDSAQGALAGIQETGENLAMITGKVNSGQGTVGKLINDKTLYQQASAGIASLHEDADALKHNFLLRGFFKDRGYTNTEEIKKSLIAQLPSQAPIKDFRLDPKAVFDKLDSAKLKSTKILNPAGEFLQSQKFGLAVIAVSSGPVGDSDKEKVLTEARSHVIRKHLVENFRLDDTRLKTIGLGKNANTPGGLVEIHVYPEQSPKAGNRPVTGAQ